MELIDAYADHLRPDTPPAPTPSPVPQAVTTELTLPGSDAGDSTSQEGYPLAASPDHGYHSHCTTALGGDLYRDISDKEGERTDDIYVSEDGGEERHTAVSAHSRIGTAPTSHSNGGPRYGPRRANTAVDDVRVRFLEDGQSTNDDGGKGKKLPKTPPKIINKHVGEDPTKLIAEINPGKKGGEFSLPFGGQLTVPAGVFGKKDVVTCCMVSPSDRYKYQPPLTYESQERLRSEDHLLSEIFILATSLKSLKKAIHMKLPYIQENVELFDVNFQWKKQEDTCWQKKECSFGAGRFVEFDTNYGGIFVMTSCPKTESFVIPVNGCLYNTKLCKQISIRIPKKAADEDMPCDIQIIPLNRDNLPNLRRDYPHDMGDMLAASDFYDIRPSISRTFRRPVTVKLPLPPMDTEEFPQEDITIMIWTSDGWQWHEVQLKFTKNSCSFDTKLLGKFCVVLCKHDRQKRLKEAFKRLQDENEVIRGDIVPFLHIQEKLWTLWFDCVPVENVGKITELRTSQGFVPVKISHTGVEEDEQQFRSRAWRSKKKEGASPSTRTDLHLINGREFELQVSGDTQVNEEEHGGAAHLGLQYHDRLFDNYRKFYIEPKALSENERADGRLLSGTLKAYKPDPSSDKGKVCIRSFEFEIDAQVVKDYYYEEPEPEPEPEREPEPEPEIEVRNDGPKSPTTPRPPNASFLRLTALAKPPKKLVKESKVLTGKSLMVLAREIEQGLTLAIHLDISDSTITGMGFDALANGLGLVDITYRILLLWKRRSSKMKDRQVDLLATALDDMGRPDLAGVILEKHRKKEELSYGCFDLDYGT